MPNNITFFGIARFDQGQRGGLHVNPTSGQRDTVGGSLLGHIHHMGLAM